MWPSGIPGKRSADRAEGVLVSPRQLDTTASLGKKELSGPKETEDKWLTVTQIRHSV